MGRHIRRKFKKQKFDIGDMVKLKDELFNSLDPFVFGPYSFSFMEEFRDKILTISQYSPEDDSVEPIYFVKEFTFALAQEWLELVKRSRKPKFEVGDWVVLKEEVFSYEPAKRLLPESARKECNHLFYNISEILRWKNRFMKIKGCRMASFGVIYNVNENMWDWHEAWLKKVK